ncbi:MAG TPA: universal stress protein [Chitinophagaceae bacterium]|jgi:nucleotide-binding universal stress UspA family protein|nr:universal stress protein [Chitinophagaceae bacterium]
MKKILAAFDGFRLSHSTLHQSIDIALKTTGHLVGIFLEDYTYHSYKIYELITEEGGGIDTKRRHLDKKDEKTRAASIAEFSEACKKAGISYSVHKDRNFALPEILRESMYGDLLVIDRNETLAHHPENVPTKFIKHLLPGIQSPVLIASDHKHIDKLILLFDSEPSSMHAIKMLAYTMDHLCELPAEVVSVNTFKEDMHVPDGRLVKEFIQRHFPAARFITLKGLAETEIMDYLKQQEGFPLVAMGAYRRGKISRWIRASLADVIMSETAFPLFIAHNK